MAFLGGWHRPGTIARAARAQNSFRRLRRAQWRPEVAIHLEVAHYLYAGGFQNFRSGGGQDIAQTITLTPGANATAGRTLRFVLQWDDPYDQTPTSIGAQVFQSSGTLTASTPQVDFAFNNPTAGQQYQIDVQGTSTKLANSALDVIVTVIQPDGTTLITQDSGNGETFSLFFPQSGAYTIRVTGYDGGTGPDEGPFTVKINQGTGVSKVTTDFNVLFFRADTGAFLGSIAENNLATNRPIELPGTLTFPNAAGPTVQMVISRANTPSAPIPASRLRYKFLDSSFPSEYFSYRTPVTYGHNSAAGANNVAAYSPFRPNLPEDLVTVDGDNSPTSQGDPNQMTVSYVGSGSVSSISFDASGGNPTGGSVVNFSTPGLVFDTRPNDGSQISGGQPFVFGPGSRGLTAANVVPVFTNPAPAPSVVGQFYGLTLTFTPGAFTGGKVLRFGVDRDEQRSAFVPPTGDSRNGSSADLTGAGVRIPEGTIVPGGVTFTGTLSDGSTFSGILANKIGAGYSFLDGFGFINAQSAVGQPLP